MLSLSLSVTMLSAFEQTLLVTNLKEPKDTPATQHGGCQARYNQERRQAMGEEVKTAPPGA